MYVRTYSHTKIFDALLTNGTLVPGNCSKYDMQVIHIGQYRNHFHHQYTGRLSLLPGTSINTHFLFPFAWFLC